MCNKDMFTDPVGPRGVGPGVEVDQEWKCPGVEVVMLTGQGHREVFRDEVDF